MTSNNKYLIYKGSGGLAHNLRGLSRAIDYCNRTKRKLVIDMHRHSGFGVNYFRIFLNNNKLSWYDSYDIIPPTLKYKGYTLDQLAKAPFGLSKHGYTLSGNVISVLDFNNRDDIVIYAGSGSSTVPINRNIQINGDIVKMLKNEQPINDKYISVHFRNTDKSNNIGLFIKKIDQLIRNTKINTLYLASDYYEAYDILKKKFNQLNIVRKTIPPKGIHNLHYGSKDKFKQIYDSIVDIYYIAQSSYFIPSINSGYSLLIIGLINGNNSLIPNIKSRTIIVNI